MEINFYVVVWQETADITEIKVCNLDSIRRIINILFCFFYNARYLSVQEEVKGVIEYCKRSATIEVK